jgi:hypothetical protein
MAQFSELPSSKKQGGPKSPVNEPSHNQKTGTTLQPKVADCGNVLTDVFELLDTARRASACIINMLMTATYWEIGRGFGPAQIAVNRSIGLRSADGGRESGAESGEERLAEQSRSETPPAVR